MHQRKNRNAFTLIEVLIAMTILAVGLLAITSLHVSSIRGNSFSGSLMQATYVAQDGLEFLKNLPLDDTSLAEGNHKDGDVTVSGMLFKRSYSVFINNDLKTINYTVTWNDGRNHTLTFSTIKSQ